MSKRTKLETLNCTKKLRSSSQLKINHDEETVNAEPTGTVSKYFNPKVVEPKKKSNRKKKSVEIKYENNDKNDDHNEKNGNEQEKWYPKNWEETLNFIREMRKNSTAPVDEMGCHKCSDTKATPPIFRYQSLVALMLSSQTKDQTNHAAMERLKAHGCTPTNIVGTSDEILGKLIYPVSFWKRKVQYIKRTSEILLKDYNGDIPDTIEGLCALPGVGPKMGHICMDIAWNKISGIGVDTHVHRICNRLQWVKKQAKSPEETRKQLESWLPKNIWSEINYLLVGFGQEICQPQRPKCEQCLNKKLCPFAKANNSK
ncbi:hypothetical protein PV326_000639 [Microctonus aethiopoides]|uniref:Endonuclease III homolog n=1 Tax=Microctonus aethiopoides TaxID=144406 RepID=A0AA39FNN9_9HYME|nr:hypothetical protein PV326_000639 [Microctonus aethiopoides]KAK0172972.1 hypothetical protein PV328_006230 [Microctonus aethiopoides]